MYRVVSIAFAWTFGTENESGGMAREATVCGNEIVRHVVV